MKYNEIIKDMENKLVIGRLNPPSIVSPIISLELYKEIGAIYKTENHYTNFTFNNKVKQNNTTIKKNPISCSGRVVVINELNPGILTTNDIHTNRIRHIILDNTLSYIRDNKKRLEYDENGNPLYVFPAYSLEEVSKLIKYLINNLSDELVRNRYVSELKLIVDMTMYQDYEVSSLYSYNKNESIDFNETDHKAILLLSLLSQTQL